MKTTFLEFEQPIAELEAKIEELRFVQDDSALDISEEIARLQKKSQALTKEIYGKLSAWQVALVARHQQRPYTLDYVTNLFTGFEELHGDRIYGTYTFVRESYASPFSMNRVTNHEPLPSEFARRLLQFVGAG